MIQNPTMFFYVVRDSREQLVALIYTKHLSAVILGDPEAASQDNGIFMGESLQQERESPWALTLSDPVPEAFEFSPSDYFWPISEEEQPGDSHVFYTRLFSSSIAVVAWPVQRAYYLGMTFIDRGLIALLESGFHFRVGYCDVPTVALFQIRNADWFVIDIRRMFTCK